MRKILLCLSLVLIVPPALAEQSTTGTIVDVSKLINMDQLLDRATSRQVVFVSETHTRYDHHLNQLAVVKRMHAQHQTLAIGLEFIQQPFQPVLNDYVAGNIDEAEMLRQSGYFEHWRYDFRLYRPLFQFAREQKIPLIALNASHELVGMVSDKGRAQVPEEMQDQLPADIGPAGDAYLKRLREIFDQHPGSDERDFERFVEVQLLWDESMAERAARWFAENPHGRMVILAGTGHIAYGDGIPQRLQRRHALTSASIINLDSSDAIDPAMGDFIVLSPEQSLPPSGQLGVILDSSVSPPSIIGFAENSAAKQAGLHEDDRIVRIDGHSIESFTDIRLALLDRTAGENVEVEITRSGFFSGTHNQTFQFKLN